MALIRILKDSANLKTKSLKFFGAKRAKIMYA